MYDNIMVRYGDLTLKGKNQKQFREVVNRQIRRKLSHLELNFEFQHDMVYIKLNDEDSEMLQQLWQMQDRFDERLTVALLAMRDKFVRPPLSHWDPVDAYDPDDCAALADRVERGPEHWLDDSNAEFDARSEAGSERDRSAGCHPA